jgi:hypothetical protein
VKKACELHKVDVTIFQPKPNFPPQLTMFDSGNSKRSLRIVGDIKKPRKKPEKRKKIFDFPAELELRDTLDFNQQLRFVDRARCGGLGAY